MIQDIEKISMTDKMKEKIERIALKIGVESMEEVLIELVTQYEAIMD